MCPCYRLPVRPARSSSTALTGTGDTSWPPQPGRLPGPVVIPAFLYERHGDRVTPVVGKLGGTLYEVTAAEALDDPRRCDFVILAKPRKVRSAYPFDESMKRLYSRMKDYCDETLRQVGSYRVFSQKVDLYVRPPHGER